MLSINRDRDFSPFISHGSFRMNKKTVHNSGGTILYDADLLKNVSEGIFTPDKTSDNHQINTLGRGSAYRFQLGDINVVLRHYRRGGFIGKVISDLYLYSGLGKTRMFREFELLAYMKQGDLPVPVPVAARVVRHGLFYSGDLITEEISNAVTLAERLKQGPLDESKWAEIASTIRRFHDQHIYHADLNANNIMIDGSGNIYLIDFDKGSVRSDGKWKEKNLARLLRSLKKIKKNSVVFNFEPRNWQDFITCYYQ